MPLDTGLSIRIFAVEPGPTGEVRTPTRPTYPHFSYPFQRGVGGKVEVVEQASEGHAMAAANVVARCPTGWREERPEFGWPWPEFRNIPLSTEALDAALREFGVDGVTYRIREYAEDDDPTIRRIDVEVVSSA